MTVRAALVAAAFLAVACGGGGGGGGGSAGTGTGTGTGTGGSTAPGTGAGTDTGGGGTTDPGQPATEGGGSGTINIGAQSVDDTPVAALPSHEGHEPLPVSPMPATPAVPPEPKYTREWHVSPNGNDSADGSAAAPFRTIGKAITVVSPGELVRVKAGTYAERLVLGGKAASASSKITLQGEGNPKIVPGTGDAAIVRFTSPHWVLDGFEIDVQGLAEYAVTFTGNVEGATLANSNVHHGALGGGITTYDNARGAIIENNRIHHFSKGGADSHGVVIQPTSKNITVRQNDIHDNSGDSVQCIGPEGYSSLPPAEGVVIENNHFYSNRENAVDIKTCHDVVIRNNRMHGFRPSTTAKGDAVVVHMSARDVIIEGNEIYDSAKGISVGGNHEGPVPNNIVVRRNRIHSISTANGGEGTGIRVENSDGAKIVHNTLRDIGGTAMMLGHGTGGPSENLVVRNNIILATKAVKVGTMAPGLQMSHNIYSAGGTLLNVALDGASLQTNVSLASGTWMPGIEAIDKGVDVGAKFCGSAPDIGAMETGC